MNNKTVPLIIIIVTILVITAAIWLVLWQSIGSTNQNQNVNKVNTNQSDQGIVYFELDKEFWMKKGQIGQLRSENLEIELTGITYSPCPEGAMCVWSGLGANIEVNKGTESKELSLVLSETVTAFRFEINLFQVQQDKVSFIVKKTQKLTISTNKIIYQKGEEVKITIDNNSSDDVVIRSPYYEIRSAGSKDEKDKIQIVRCPCGMVCEALAPFLTLKKGEKLEYTWNQANQRCEGDNQVNEQVAVGSYRVVSYLKNNKEWQDFIYADFTITKKSSGITVTTDKTEYQKGESVKITVTNSTASKIGFEPSFSPAFGLAKIYKKDSYGEWQIIYINTPEPDVPPPPETRDWSIILNAGEQYSFAWGQKIFDATLDEYTQAATGTYRFQLQWYVPGTKLGDFVYSNEFTIKEQIVCGGFGYIKCPVSYYCYIENQVVADAQGICKLNSQYIKKCCQECNDSFSHDPTAVGSDKISCIQYKDSGNNKLSDECIQFFRQNSMGVSQCLNIINNYRLPDIKNQAECEVLGAHWSYIGKMNGICELSAPDVGKECAKAADCIRTCEIKGLEDKIGTCSEYSSGGCLRYLDKEGRAQMICID